MTVAYMTLPWIFQLSLIILDCVCNIAKDNGLKTARNMADFIEGLH